MAVFKRIKGYLNSTRQYSGWEEAVLYMLVAESIITTFTK